MKKFDLVGGRLGRSIETVTRMTEDRTTKMKKSARSLTLSILALLPTVSYAIPQNLAVDFRSPQIGAQVENDPTRVTLSDGIGFSGEGTPPFVWSNNYGIAEKAGRPLQFDELMLISGLPSITGMWIDDINNPKNAISEPLYWVGLNSNDLEVSAASGDTVRTEDGVTIRDEFGTGDHNAFISFSKPVDQVWVGGYDRAFAIEGFTGSDQSKHVPDGGGTLILFALALVGLIAFKKRAARVQHCPPQRV
jgi:hypothetical protein